MWEILNENFLSVFTLEQIMEEIEAYELWYFRAYTITKGGGDGSLEMHKDG